MPGWKQFEEEARGSICLRLEYLPSSKTDAFFKTQKGLILIQSEAMRLYLNSVADTDPECAVSNVVDTLKYKELAINSLDLVSRELQQYELELPQAVQVRIDSLLCIAENWTVLFVSMWLVIPIDVG